MSESAGTAAEPSIEVVNDEAGGYYELRVDGAPAGLLIYERFGSRLVVTHTAVAEAFQGHGFSWRMMSDAMDDVRDRHETVTNTCPVLDRFLMNNPQYTDLLDRDHPGMWPERLSA